jgi:two-component system CheB/CheR fusion protein
MQKPADGYAILNSLAAHVAVLNPEGSILFTNEAWNRFAQENGNPPLTVVGPGANYLAVYIQAVFDGAPGAQAILSGIKDILEAEGTRSVWNIPVIHPPNGAGSS